MENIKKELKEIATGKLMVKQGNRVYFENESDAKEIIKVMKKHGFKTHYTKGLPYKGTYENMLPFFK